MVVLAGDVEWSGLGLCGNEPYFCQVGHHIQLISAKMAYLL